MRWYRRRVHGEFTERRSQLSRVLGKSLHRKYPNQSSRWATVQGCVLSSLHSSSLPSRCCWCAVVAVTSFLTSSSPSSPTYQVESPSPSSSLSSSSTYLIIILLLHIIITICHHYHNYSSPTKSEIFPQA